MSKEQQGRENKLIYIADHASENLKAQVRTSFRNTELSQVVNFNCAIC